MTDDDAPTLGEIAEQLRVLKAQGVTHASIMYALSRVYEEEITAAQQALARLRKERGMTDA